MVTITKQDKNIIFEIKGLHKIWAFKSKIIIPFENIVKVHKNIDNFKGYKGWGVPATAIPFFVTAGTFYKNGSKNFWDVSDLERSIIIELKNEKYKTLIIEVNNPVDALDLLKIRK